MKRNGFNFSAKKSAYFCMVEMLVCRDGVWGVWWQMVNVFICYWWNRHTDQQPCNQPSPSHQIHYPIIINNFARYFILEKGLHWLIFCRKPFFCSRPSVFSPTMLCCYCCCCCIPDFCSEFDQNLSYFSMRSGFRRQFPMIIIY